MSDPLEPRPRQSILALALAWLVVLGLIAAAVVFVVIEPVEEASTTASVSIAPPNDTAGEATLESPAAPSNEETQPASPLPEQEPGIAAATGSQSAAIPEPVNEEESGQGAADDAPQADETAEQPGADQAEALQAESEIEQIPEPGPEATTETAEQTALMSMAPWRRFSTASEATESQPKIAIVITGLGLSAAATEAAIKQLPAAITLSFSPYARRLNQWITLARVNDHEVMLDLPMEPVTYPEDDPGPHALLTLLDASQNLARLDWILSRANSIVGVTGVMGSRFTTSEKGLRPVLEDLKKRGLMILDNRVTQDSVIDKLASGIALPYVLNDRALDAAQASRVAIDARLTEVERLARENGFAVAIGQPYPVTIERLRDWTATIKGRGIALVPITALADITQKLEPETAPSN